MKYVFLFILVFLFGESNAQKLIAQSTYNHDSLGYYIADSIAHYYHAGNNTTAQQQFDQGDVGFHADSSRQYNGVQLDLGVINNYQYDASYSKVLAYHGDFYSAGVLTSQYAVQYYYTGVAPDSTIYTQTDVINNQSHVAERDYYHINGQNQIDTSWNIYLNNVGAYSNSNKYAKIYTGNNLTEVWSYASTDSIIYNVTSKTIYFYNGNNAVDSSIAYAWQAGNWYKVAKVGYAYNAANSVIVKQNWFYDNNLNMYVNSGRDQINRLPDNTRDTLYSQLWLANPGVFDTTVKYAYAYQGGMLMRTYGYNKNPNTLQWQPDPYNAIRYFYYDMLPNKVSDVKKDNRLTIYPNPVEDILHIQENVAGSKYSIMSSEGKFVQSGIFDKSHRINIQQLNTGVYFLLCERPSHGVAQIRFVKQ